eukprot:3886103-Pyramimonas_sp.AAC.1
MNVDDGASTEGDNVSLERIYDRCNSGSMRERSSSINIDDDAVPELGPASTFRGSARMGKDTIADRDAIDKQ